MEMVLDCSSRHGDVVLDLSCSKRQLTVEKYYSAFDDMKHGSKRSYTAYTQNYSPDSTSNYQQYEERVCTPDRVPEVFSSANISPTKSPSLYRTEACSPSYVACYPSVDHLNSQMIQAAYHQKKIRSLKQERDDTSETGSEGSSSSPMYTAVAAATKDGKIARPFKAYPKDPFSMAAGFTTADAILNTQSAEKYSAFRESMLKQIFEANGGQATVSNPKMRRTVNTGGYSSEDGKPRSEDPSKDGAYFERRKKNNAAAKKSRDRRRIKEDEIAIRAAFLERENIELKFELAAARKQLALYGVSAT